MQDFINEHKYPTIMPFNDQAAERIFSSGLDCLILLIGKDADNKKDNEIAEKSLEAVSKKLKKEIVLVKTGIKIIKYFNYYL